MGKAYSFECAKCGYRATVAGRADRGQDAFVQTIVCRDCKHLFDIVTRWRVPDESGWRLGKAGNLQARPISRRPASRPPAFQSLLNRLPYKGVRRFQWLQFKPQCPVSSLHRVQLWNDPDKCPRCGIYLEKNVLPYRIWD